MAIELATAYVSIVPSARGMGGNLAKELSAPAQEAGQQAGDEISRGIAKRTAPGVKTLVGAIGGAAAIGGAFAFLDGAVESASNLNETVSKARTVFGPAAGDIEKWASTAAKSIGQSRQQALDAAGSFGNLFVQLGIGSGQAAAMSKEMVGLASDFASFHNADISQVLDAQAAAFRGEYDSLQRFVPTINAAAVEQEALAQTGKKTTKELTAQEKALAVQSLMLKGAGDAAGDFARTSDGLANKQRIQAAQWEDLKAKIGSGLLPVITKLTGFIVNTLAPGMEKLIRFISKNKDLFVALGVGIMAALVPAFIAWAAAAIPAAAATLLAAAPVIALGAAVAAVALVIVKNWDTIKAAVAAAFRWIKEHIDLILVVALGPLGLAIALLRNNWDTVWNAISTAVETAWKIIRPIIKLIREAIDKISGPIKTVVGAVGKLGGAVGGTVGKVGGLLGFDSGGVVPGPTGAPRVIVAHGGETILPTHKTSMGTGLTISTHVDARGVDDPAAVGDYTSRMIGWRLGLAGGL